MTTFRYKFTKPLLTLIIFGIIVCALSIAFNIYRASLAMGTLKISIYLLIFVSFALLIILVSLTVSSVYVITGDKLITRFGVIKSYIRLSDITQICHYVKKERLIIYFNNTKYSVIVVNKIWFDDFVNKLLQANSKIEYQKTSLNQD